MLLLTVNSVDDEIIYKKLKVKHEKLFFQYFHGLFTVMIWKGQVMQIFSHTVEG